MKPIKNILHKARLLTEQDPRHTLYMARWCIVLRHKKFYDNCTLFIDNHNCYCYNVKTLFCQLYQSRHDIVKYKQEENVHNNRQCHIKCTTRLCLVPVTLFLCYPRALLGSTNPILAPHYY